MTNLEYVRRTRGWTQSQLGRLRTVRISPSFIGLCEQRRGIPNDDQRERLARALDLRPELLLEEVAIVGAVPVVDEPADDPERVQEPADAFAR